jgi:hypothetical protein
MPSRMLTLLTALAFVLANSPAPACSLCGNGFQQSPTFREEAAQSQARLILYGTLHKGQLNPDGVGGTTELHLAEVLRNDPAIAGKKMIVLPRYMPTNEKDPPRFLVFCDIFKDKLDPYRGLPLKSADAVDYVKKAIARDPRDKVGNLLFYFNYLEHPDKEVAQDAFLEFAKATDQEIGLAAAKLSSAKLRRWIESAETPPERLGLYALLLGACGSAADSDFLAGMLKKTDERALNAYDGLLGGYIRLKPKEGWDLALATLADGRKPLPIRLRVVRTLRFYLGWQPKESRATALRAFSLMIQQGELADVAVEDLRRYQMWDLTKQVLGIYGKKGYDAPLMQRTIVRYALCAPVDADVRRFLDDRRKTEPDLIKEEEELLQAERR